MSNAHFKRRRGGSRRSGCCLLPSLHASRGSRERCGKVVMTVSFNHDEMRIRSSGESAAGQNRDDVEALLASLRNAVQAPYLVSFRIGHDAAIFTAHRRRRQRRRRGRTGQTSHSSHPSFTAITGAGQSISPRIRSGEAVRHSIARACYVASMTN